MGLYGFKWDLYGFIWALNGPIKIDKVHSECGINDFYQKEMFQRCKQLNIECG